MTVRLVLLILAISVLLQFTAAFLALRLIRITGRRRAWLFIASGISFMAIRRSVTLFHMFTNELPHPPDLIAELVALATSIFMVIGVALIAPVFLSIKHSEMESRRVNRALKTLSGFNKAMMRATQESDLLHDICRIIVEIGGYRLAWVGFAEQDKEKTVRPVAQAGYEEGYLEGAKVTWSDTERGQCPVGTAIRTGIPDIARDIRTDPRLKPWRDEALKRGYHSVIGLPLFINKKNIGALAIYAAEPDVFNTEEMELLMELTNDLAYGIKSLRISAEHKQAEEIIERLHRLNELVLNSAGEGILGLDTQGKYTFVNPSAANMIGYDVEELIGQPSHAIWHHSKTDGSPYLEEECPIYEAYKDGVVHHVTDEIFWRKDGTGFPVEYTSTPILEDGRLIGAVVTFKDIAERKKVEEALHKSEEELRKRVKELEEFYDMAVGRELKMKELKEEIEILKKELEKHK
jgi:PAS domain S-box-containing protein